MGKFNKISIVVLEAENELREYLLRASFSDGKKGGTFVGTFSVAPEGFRKYGIVLPKGGMILPEESPEEISSMLDSFREKERRSRQLLIDDEKRLIEEWKAFARTNLVPRVLSLFDREHIVGEAIIEDEKGDYPFLKIWCVREGHSQVNVHYPNKSFEAEIINNFIENGKYLDQIDSLRKEIVDLELVPTAGMEDEELYLYVAGSSLSFGDMWFTISDDGIRDCREHLKRIKIDSEKRKEDLKRLILQGFRIQSETVRFKDQKAFWNFGVTQSTVSTFNGAQLSPRTMSYIRKLSEKVDREHNLKSKKESVARLSIRIFVVCFYSRTKSETVYDEVGNANSLLERAVKDIERLNVGGRFFKIIISPAGDTFDDLSISFHSSLYGNNERFSDLGSVVNFIRKFDLCSLVK